MTTIIDRLSDIAAPYDAVFCDVWGCIHNGVAPFDEAVEALRGFRAGGGSVVLLTNAPRPWRDVAEQIREIGIPDDCWDMISTSGDSARLAMFDGAVGDKVYFIGKDIDLGFFEPMQIADKPHHIARVPLEEAEGIVLTGPFDAHAPLEDMRPTLLYAKQKGLPLLCANPDIVVDRGDRREYCAGAIAELYTEMGGESLYFGKPHPPIYDLARRRLHKQREVPADRILAIGDGIMTDIAGAMGEDIDALFVTGGLAAAETGTTRQPDPDKLAAYLADHGFDPAYSIGFLR